MDPRRPLPRLPMLPPLLPPPPPPAQMQAQTQAQTQALPPRAPARARAADGEVDDKVLRRRLQYKHHQRRHRAKQKEKTLALERDVCALSADVDALRRRREALAGGRADVDLDLDLDSMVRSSALLCDSRGAAGGAPARTVVEFFRLYAGGWSAAREPEQQRFLRAVMTPETRGPDYTGVEFVLDQFRRFGAFFALMRIDTRAPHVATAGDMTVVTMDAVLRVRPHRAGLMAICPGVQNDERAVQALVGAQLVVPSRYTFVFDEAGKVDFFGADTNFLEALQRATGSLHATAELFADARMSSATGQIYAALEPAPPRQPEPLDRRLQLDFLLS